MNSLRSIALFLILLLEVSLPLFSQLTLYPKEVFPNDSMLAKLSVAPNGDLYVMGAIDRNFIAHKVLQLLPCSELFRSIDTARTWKAVTLPKEMPSITMLKHRNNTLYLAGYSSSATLQTLGIPLLAISDDGGMSWETRPIVSTLATVDITVTSTGAIIAAVSYLSEPLRTVIVSDTRFRFRPPVKFAQILRSLDNGKTWQELLQFATPLRTSIFGVSVNSDGMIIAATDEPFIPPSITLGFPVPFIHYSFDDGNTWKNIPFIDEGLST